MAKVVWTARAFAQLEKAITYIKDERGQSYASIVLERILEVTAHLENQPRFGAVEPLLKHKKLQYRYLVAFSYKIIYRVDENNDKVVVSRVFHTSRNPKKLKGI
ncbi:MAG: type II toxin-antitoxin system RelE/ParE family toxin [Bacteroidetes bacterium]|nr:type II toxin-antitoxin system RelE/ParE family toxin [Bacteroidota bacterium]